MDRSLNYGRDVIQQFFRDVAPYSSVLDLGAGAGGDLRSARWACPEADLYGVEWEEAAAASLRAIGVSPIRIDLERESLPFANESMSVICTNQTLEHVKEVFWIFHEISRTLEVGGHVILGVPNLASLHNRLLLLLGRQPTVIQTHSAHVRGFTYPGICNFLGVCFPGGYDVVERRGSNFYPFPRTPAKYLAEHWPTAAWGLFLLLKKVRPYESGFLDFPRTERLETPYFLGPDRDGIGSIA